MYDRRIYIARCFGRKVFVVPGTEKRTRKGRSVTRRRIEGKATP
jgi:hypothetical protein